MGGDRKLIEHVEHMLRNIASSRPCIADIDYIIFRGQLADEHEIKNAFRQRLRDPRRFWQLHAELGNRVPPKSNSFFRIKFGSFSYHSNHALHPGIYLLNCILADDMVS